MYNKDFPAIRETEAELLALIKRQRDVRLRARLHLLHLIRSNRVTSRREAAEFLAVHRNSITIWLKAYENGGLDGMLHLGKGGPAPEQKTLPPDVLESLRSRVEAGDFSSYKAARDWLLAVHKIDVPYRTVHGLIRTRLGLKLKSRRSSV